MNSKIDQLKNQYLNLNKRIEVEKDRINLAKGQIEEINDQLMEEIHYRDEFQSKQVLYQKTAIFCSSMLENAQSSLEKTFSDIGSAALAKIFGDDKKLQFTFDKKKKQNPAVKITVSQSWDDNDNLVTNVMDAEGGAMMDIVSLGLRLAMIKLISPEQKGPIFLDEICRYIAKNESIKSTGEFIKEVSKKLNKQIILITHTKELFDYADKLFVLDMAQKQTIIVKEQEKSEKEES